MIWRSSRMAIIGRGPCRCSNSGNGRAPPSLPARAVPPTPYVRSRARVGCPSRLLPPLPRRLDVVADRVADRGGVAAPGGAGPGVGSAGRGGDGRPRSSQQPHSARWSGRPASWRTDWSCHSRLLSDKDRVGHAVGHVLDPDHDVGDHRSIPRRRNPDLPLRSAPAPSGRSPSGRRLSHSDVGSGGVSGRHIRSNVDAVRGAGGAPDHRGRPVVQQDVVRAPGLTTEDETQLILL